jgi:hypothetical protein
MIPDTPAGLALYLPEDLFEQRADRRFLAARRRRHQRGAQPRHGRRIAHVALADLGRWHAPLFEFAIEAR